MSSRERYGHTYASSSRQRAPAPNAAQRRLQLAPSDPRWALSEREWRFTSHPAGSGLCWFCALPVGGDSLFSAPLRMYAHRACNGNA